MNERFQRGALPARIDLAHEPEFSLGQVRVRPAHREIAGNNWRETVEPRVMQVLVALARANGEILSRDDLIECCWDGIIVGEDAINRCIGRLRKVAEASGSVFAIETVPRVGYRLKTLEGAAAPAESALEIQPNYSAASEPPRGRNAAAAASPEKAGPLASARLPFSTAAALLALIAAGLAAWQLWPRSGTEAAASAASVAVLPFANMSGDRAKEYFSDGFSEELLDVLSADPRLRVAARTSAFAFKGRNDSIQSIARALNVRAIVQGSVREAGNRVRVAAQLIDAGNGYSIWSASYDRNVADVLSMQDELARAIAAALTHKLLPPAPASQRREIDPAVYRLYLEGREALRPQSLDSSRKAVALFRRVTLRQRDFAAGFAALAHAAYRLSTFDPAHAKADLAAAAEAAQMALLLDPRNIESRVIREVLEFWAWDWPGAASDLQKLWKQNPNDVQVLIGARISLNQMGFPEEANRISQRVLSLDPLTFADAFVLVRNLLHGGHYPEAEKVALRLLARDRNQPQALSTLCASFARTGDVAKARAVEQQLQRVGTQGAAPSDLEECAFESAVANGDLTAGRRIVEGWEAQFPDKVSSAADLAEHYIQLGDFSKASEWYERGYARHEPGFFRTVYWPGGAKYRMAPRWKALTRKPQFREWQAEHDRIAADLAAHRWPSPGPDPAF